MRHTLLYPRQMGTCFSYRHASAFSIRNALAPTPRLISTANIPVFLAFVICQYRPMCPAMQLHNAWLLIVFPGAWKCGLCEKLCNLTPLMSHTTRNTWASNQGTIRCMSRMLHVADILCGQSTLLRHRFPTEG